MHVRVSPRQAVLAAMLATGAAQLLLLGATGTRSNSPLLAFSCFNVSETVTCIDTARTGPVMPALPAVIVPVAVGDGEHESIVIRDNGGEQVARG